MIAWKNWVEARAAARQNHRAELATADGCQ
jgi:hypothetical protein